MWLYRVFIVIPRLLWSIGWFVFLVTTDRYREWFLPSLLAVGLAVEVWFIATTQPGAPQSILREPVSAALPPGLEAVETVVVSKENLIQQKAYYEDLYRLQPTHRDILLNLALISLYSRDSQSFYTLWQSAVQADPNFPLFKNP